jgi:DNA modification methylase
VTPFVQDTDFTLYVGDVREVLAELPPESVHCVVTSPPYWGLRDYSTEGQLGLEPTPDAYVENMVGVFREVRRVLRRDGTCWLNLGDSYAANRSYQVSDSKHKSHDFADSNALAIPPGLKPKDLVGIPWAVAKALQEPYYTGRIPRERDRVWLAATIDAEGSICGFTHERADGDGIRTGVHINITNTSMAMLAEAQRIWPTSRDDGNGHGSSALGERECRRWIAHNVDDKAALLRELYPYLIAKRTQALLAWNFLEMSRVSKRIGKKAEGAQAKERRAWIVGALSDLNHGREVTIPPWIVEPPSLYEEGWYLRSDIIWAKPNPMPESVTDRPTKAHEMVFLLTKSARYYFDADSVRERFTVAGVVQGADLTSESRVLGDDLRFEVATPVAEIGVRLAATILDGAKSQKDLGLRSLDAQVGQEGRDDVAGDLVARVPVERRATAQAARFADGDVPAKEFLREVYGLWITLADGDQLKEAWRFAFAHAVLVDANGDRPVGVHDAGEVGQFELVHDEQYTSGPTPSRGPDGRRVTHVEGRDGSAQHRSGERWPTPSGRNCRSVWTIATQPYADSHFATFPEELVSRCVKAGTSERGCCPECGAPWVRDVETGDAPFEPNRRRNVGGRTDGYTISSGPVPSLPRSTLGWSPSCDCGADPAELDEAFMWGAPDEIISEGIRDELAPVPATVLDPFMGSGTTALVARKHGRRSIGIELNEEYAAIAAKRLSQLSLLAESAA